MKSGVVGRRPEHAQPVCHYLSRSSFRRLAGRHCRLFLSYGILVFDAVGMPCSGLLHVSHITDYVYDCCPLSDQDVGHFVLACDAEHTSFHVGVPDRKFVLCLFGECLCISITRHSWQDAHPGFWRMPPSLAAMTVRCIHLSRFPLRL